MLKYNTSEKKIVMPEYGRHIQKLVEHCKTIEDRDERTAFAYLIADIMSQQFPQLASENNGKRKIWDHIYIISGFELDVDYPFEVVNKENLFHKANKIPYNHPFDQFRHYGKNIVEMLKNVSDMENCVEKDQMIFLIANQMKKLLVSQNPENANDSRVFKDIDLITGGKITISEDNYRLNDYIGVTPASNNKKKKKK